MIVEYFKSADQTIEIYPLKNGGNLFAYLKDGEVICFKSFEDTATYLLLGDPVSRIYMNEADLLNYIETDTLESIVIS